MVAHLVDLETARGPLALEELAEDLEGYCRDRDRPSGSPLSMDPDDPHPVDVFYLWELGGFCREAFGPSDHPPLAGLADLSRKLLIRSLATHAGAWRKTGALLDVVTENTEPMRKLNHEARASGLAALILEDPSAGTIRREQGPADARIRVAELLAVAALACEDLLREGPSRDPPSYEGAAELRRLLAGHRIGARQYTPWLVNERIGKLTRVNEPLLSAMTRNRYAGRDMLAGLADAV